MNSRPRPHYKADHVPTKAQILDDAAQVEAWLQRNRPTKLPPATADYAVSIYVQFSMMPHAKRGRRSQS